MFKPLMGPNSETHRFLLNKTNKLKNSLLGHVLSMQELFLYQPVLEPSCTLLPQPYQLCSLQPIQGLEGQEAALRNDTWLPEEKHSKLERSSVLGGW
jgi:hypothetical protein